MGAAILDDVTVMVADDRSRGYIAVCEEKKTYGAYGVMERRFIDYYLYQWRILLLLLVVVIVVVVVVVLVVVVVVVEVVVVVVVVVVVLIVFC